MRYKIKSGEEYSILFKKGMATYMYLLVNGHTNIYKLYIPNDYKAWAKAIDIDINSGHQFYIEISAHDYIGLIDEI